MKENPRSNSQVTAPAGGRFAFLQRNYDETVKLLQQCSNYLEYQGKYERVTMSIEDRVLYTIATSHITVQLTSVLSWLMAWKAVEAGEISFEDLKRSRYKLQEVRPLSEEQMQMFSRLSQPIPNLMEASCNLYTRMHRLESGMCEEGA